MLNIRQEDNARVLEKLGAAKIILNHELTGEKLSKEIDAALPRILIYCGSKSCSISIPILDFGKSRICPIEATGRNEN